MRSFPPTPTHTHYHAHAIMITHHYTDTKDSGGESIISGFSSKTDCKLDLANEKPFLVLVTGRWWLQRITCPGQGSAIAFFQSPTGSGSAMAIWFSNFHSLAVVARYPNTAHFVANPRTRPLSTVALVSVQFGVRKVLPLIARGPTQALPMKIENEFRGKRKFDSWRVESWLGNVYLEQAYWRNTLRGGLSESERKGENKDDLMEFNINRNERSRIRRIWRQGPSGDLPVLWETWKWIIIASFANVN